MRIDIPEVILPADQLGRVHFVGIGGAGLSAIARLMAGQGVTVTGSDMADSSVLQALRAEGITCHVGQDAAHLSDVDTVIATTAVREDNAEIVEAQRLGLRLWPRSAGLQSVLLGGRAVAVAGTHGKTTTTAMLTCALRAAGADPSFAIGAEVASLGTNARRGSGDVIVAEADESDGAFLVYTPFGAVVTNVDADHLDQWGTEEAYAAAFVQFVGQVSGFVVLNTDDAGAAVLSERVAADASVWTVGFDGSPRLRGTDLVVDGSSTTFSVENDGSPLVDVRLAVPGAALRRRRAARAGCRLGAGPRCGAPCCGSRHVHRRGTSHATARQRRGSAGLRLLRPPSHRDPR